MRASEASTQPCDGVVSVRGFVFAALVIMIAGAAVLYVMGRPLICTCGYVKLWESQVFSAGNSQHLTDWYTFTHVAHGFLFYFLIWLGSKLTGIRFCVAMAFVAAVAIETGWEVFENTNFIIDRYRAATPDFGYYGDSVLNSVSDIIAMMIGFILAARLPLWLSTSIVIAMECLLALVIRDNLALNIVMLLYPVDAIRDWQQAIVK